jgi:hypothetical protein
MTPQAEVVSIVPSTSSADAFLPQIRAAIDEAADAEGTALDAAIRAGHLLQKAKDNVKAEKVKWSTWLIKNAINQTTASLYKRLAKHEEEIRKAGYRSIREADVGLRPSDDDDTGTETHNGVVNSESSGADNPALAKPKTVRRRRANGDNIEAALKPLVPDEVFIALRGTWDRDDLVKLADLLVAHLKETAKETAA